MKEKLQALRALSARVHDRVVVGAGLALASASSFAQSTDPFDTTKDAVIAKVLVYGGGLLLVAGAGVIFMVGVKYVKKIARAA